MTPRWTPERVALLTRLHAEGRTAREIAAELGDDISRGAVIGKLWRLGIPTTPAQTTTQSKPPRPPRAPRPAKASAAAGEPAMPVCNPTKVSPTAPPPPPAPQPEPLGAGPACAALRDRHCRWPIGNPAADDFRFCAEPCMRHPEMPRGRDGRLRVPVYCAAHYELSVQPSAERRVTRIMAAA